MAHFPEDSDKTIYTVSDLNQQVKKSLEGVFGNIRLRGEISGLSEPASGHKYFTLKDESAALSCALFRGTQFRIQHKLDSLRLCDGLEVILTGKVTIYTARGNYQFIVDDIESTKDKGQLFIAYEKLRKDLEQKGYFNEDKKHKPKPYPSVVGVITSRSGAVIEDIKKVFERRNPSIALVIYPVAVQGDGAGKQIAQAIIRANQRSNEEVLIIARGGGSIEDLWAFNEKVVADAIHASELPIITGIGHQSDFTIADFVADVRAATPTAAAELITTPSLDEMIYQLDNYQAKIKQLVLAKTNDLAQHIDIAEKRLVHPKQRIKLLEQQFNSVFDKLKSIENRLALQRAGQINQKLQELLKSSPTNIVSLYKQRIEQTQNRLELAASQRNINFASKINSLESKLGALSPHSTLSRGYAIIRTVDSQSIVRRSDQVQQGEKVLAQLGRGSLQCSVDSTFE